MNNRLAGLAAVAALLGGYVAFESFGLPGSGSNEGASPATTVAARNGTVKLNPLEGTEPSSFAAIIERPLFNPGRQPRPADVVEQPPPQVEQPPPEPPPPPAPQGPGPEDYKLLGVSSGPDGNIAALRVAASGDVVYLRKGESIDGWRVVDVGERSVAIGPEDSPVTYGLFDDVNAAPQPPVDGGSPPPNGMDASQVPGTMPLPLPLPLPMPKQQPPADPAVPEQHTVPPDTGG